MSITTQFTDKNMTGAEHCFNNLLLHKKLTDAPFDTEANPTEKLNDFC